MSARVRRDGAVLVKNQAGVEARIGWTDQYDRMGRASNKWRGVLEGGRQQGGFRTRAEAVEWMTGDPQ